MHRRAMPPKLNNSSVLLWFLPAMSISTRPSHTKAFLTLLAVIALLSSGRANAADKSTTGAGYFDHTGRTDVLSGGVRMIEVQTPKGKFKVWTKRVGNNPRIKLLLLHGGPGATH